MNYEREINHSNVCNPDHFIGWDDFGIGPWPEVRGSIALDNNISVIFACSKIGVMLKSLIGRIMSALKYADSEYPGIIYHAYVEYECNEDDLAILECEIVDSELNYRFTEHRTEGFHFIDLSFELVVKTKIGEWVVPVNLEEGDNGLRIGYEGVHETIKLQLEQKLN